MAATIRSKYVGKVDTIALLILGGVDPRKLQEWYPDMTNEEIEKAQKKIKALDLKEVKRDG